MPPLPNPLLRGGEGEERARVVRVLLLHDASPKNLRKKLPACYRWDSAFRVFRGPLFENQNLGW